MTRAFVCGLSLLALSAGDALAQNCVNASTAGLPSASITTLVTNQYVCANISPTQHWNELHSSPDALDYKMGPTDPVDRSDTATHPTGRYAISNGTVRGITTYTYGSDSYGYYVVGNLTHPQYSFCGESGGAPNLAVTMLPAHC